VGNAPCYGRGSNSGVIAGMNWVRTNGVRPAVANMSLGGGFSQAVNSAATNLAHSGVFLAVAAGNGNANTCNTSPASASGVFTVAASDRNDRVDERRNEYHQRHIDGYTARHRRRRALQEPQW